MGVCIGIEPGHAPQILTKGSLFRDLKDKQHDHRRQHGEPNPW